jgi:hypothetical protein
MRLVSSWRKCPSVVEMLQWPFDCFYFYLSRSIQRNLAPESLLKRAKADDKVGDDLLLIFLENPCAAAPGDERRVIFDVGHDGEKLVGTIGESCLLLVTRHVTPPRYDKSTTTDRFADADMVSLR